MIGSVVNFSGSFAFGGFGSGLAGGLSSFASGASSRLLAGSALASLDAGRGHVDEIKAALTKLRDALQAARDTADPVPGRTTLKPVTAEIDHYVDKPTWVTINGAPVQNGTVTVKDGTQKLVVGYERVNRYGPEISEGLRVLLRATTAVGTAPGLDNLGTFGDQIAAFLKSADLDTAVTRPDKAALDGALEQVNGLLTSAEGLGFTVNSRAAAASRIDLGGLLLGASPGLFDGSSSSTGSSGSGAYQATSTSTSDTSSGSTLSTVA